MEAYREVRKRRVRRTTMGGAWFLDSLTWHDGSDAVLWLRNGGCAWVDGNSGVSRVGWQITRSCMRCGRSMPIGARVHLHPGGKFVHRKIEIPSRPPAEATIPPPAIIPGHQQPPVSLSRAPPPPTHLAPEQDPHFLRSSSSRVMLSSPSRRPGKRPAPPASEDGDGDGVDRISSLPDDLLHLVLVRLGCAREAARTSFLARRWRSLWTRLPEYTFDGIEPESVEAALAQVTRPALDCLDIKADLKTGAALRRVSSLLRGAARLLPETVSIDLDNQVGGMRVGILLPCFDHTSSLVLKMDDLPITPLPASDFSRLESLELATCSNIFAELLPLCPCLHVLRILATRELNEVTVHSATLEELVVQCFYMFTEIRRIDIDAPELKKVKLDVEMDQEFSMTFSAPKVEELDWTFRSMHGNVGLATLRLFTLDYSLCQGVRSLRLKIDCTYEVEVPDRTFAQEILRLGVTGFSVLEVVVETNGHSFGPLLLQLLQIQPAIQRLKVVIDEGEDEEEELCPQNCPCRQPINWRSETVPLFDLEEVHISYDLEGGDEEVDFLKLLFQSAPGLKSMRAGVRDKVYKKIHSICDENPHVKCETAGRPFRHRRVYPLAAHHRRFLSGVLRLRRFTCPPYQDPHLLRSSSSRVMLSSPSHRPGKRQAPPGEEVGDGDGEDRISSLPDDLLHLVLVRLGCAREAARAGILAGRWRGLWTRLPEYTFWDMEPEAVEAALAHVTRPTLDRLDIKADLKSVTALGRVSSLLRGAARLAPEKVSFNLDNQVVVMWEGIELPCFDRTTSLVLKMDGVPIAPPPAGEFSRLESLELATGSNIFAALLPSCPRLHVLRILATRELKEVTVHSATLEELVVQCFYLFSDIRRIDIDAPELKKVKLNVEMDQEFSMTFSAPKVEELDWRFRSMHGNIGLAIMRLFILDYNLSQGVRNLRLKIDSTYETPVPDRTFAQEIARLGVTGFSVLEVVVETNGHAFGPLLLDLLHIRPAIRKLDLVIQQDESEKEDNEEEEEEELCPQNCPCRQPINWRNETIPLFDLEEVLISYDLDEGGDEEVDFLKLLFRCAPGLKSIRVGVHDKVYKKISSICDENPHAKG
ncbi:hypothetical protein EJB05_12610, partial [Eragrostis curvula]